MKKPFLFREKTTVFFWGLWLTLFLAPQICFAEYSQMSGNDINIILRAAVVEDLLGGDENRLSRESVIDIDLMKSLVPIRLDPVLLKCGLEPGIDLGFRRPGRETTGHIANYILLCPNNEIAQAMTKRAALQRGHFKSKIATPFSWIIIGRRVVIIFTEASLDKELVRWIKESVRKAFDVQGD
ncbi:MAG: hypothetical protein LBI92_00940 [Azoarcus sp.]|jgi:hypothetical protein|nr:hypothetical protein [Azoarcus sp.]